MEAGAWVGKRVYNWINMKVQNSLRHLWIPNILIWGRVPPEVQRWHMRVYFLPEVWKRKPVQISHPAENSRIHKIPLLDSVALGPVPDFGLLLLPGKLWRHFSAGAWVLPRPGPRVWPPQLLLGGPPCVRSDLQLPLLSSALPMPHCCGGRSTPTHLPRGCFYTTFSELLQYELWTQNNCSHFQIIYERIIKATCYFTWQFLFLIRSYFLQLPFRMEVLNQVRWSFLMTKSEAIYQNSLYLYFHIFYANDVITQETFL